jgi:hypothetical protein
VFYKTIKGIRNEIPTTVLGSLEAIIKIEKLQRELRDRNENNDFCILTFDVEDMYTSIPVPEAMKMIRELLKDREEKGLIFLLTTAMELIFANNAVQFGDTTILQKDGFGMGWSSSPGIADLFVYHKVEKNLLEIHRPLLYCRLLDDGLVAFKTVKEAQAFFEDLKNTHPKLRFTYDISTTKAIFLDITLHKDHGIWYRGLYVKETSNFTMVHKRSEHSPSLKNAVLYGRFLWFLRVCDNSTDLINACTSFWKAAKRQGYDNESLTQAMTKSLEAANANNWPFCTNPSPRIASMIRDQLAESPRKKVNKNKARKIRYKRTLFTRNTVRTTKRMTSKWHSQNILPAWSYGNSIQKVLMKSDHRKPAGLEEQQNVK